jgi:3-phosphoshikimate 1-carboxyvinyltransferase
MAVTIRSSGSVEIVAPRRPLVGKAAPPGSKSITNRALLLAALATGVSRLTGALKSDDTARMAESLIAMGVAVDEPDGSSFLVSSDGRLRAPSHPLFLGNAGTAARFLTAAVALADGTVVLDGDAQMRKRPISPLVTALAQLGVEARAPTGCPPVTVEGRGYVSGGRVEIDAGLSSQFVSALLMLAPRAEAPVEVALMGADIGARGYVELTLAAMRAFGAVAEPIGAGVWRVRSTGYIAADLHIEPDASAATYLWAAERLTEGRIDQGVEAASFTQPDAAAHAVISAWPHMPAVIDGSQMQDAVPTLAAMAAFNTTPVRFVGVANLRVKECDRLSALSTELSRLKPGLAVEEGDELVVTGDPSLMGRRVPVRIETYADHRIAMALSLVGLLVEGVCIVDPACTAKTWPEWWDVLRGLGVELKFSA